MMRKPCCASRSSLISTPSCTHEHRFVTLTTYQVEERDALARRVRRSELALKARLGRVALPQHIADPDVPRCAARARLLRSRLEERRRGVRLGARSAKTLALPGHRLRRRRRTTRLGGAGLRLALLLGRRGARGAGAGLRRRVELGDVALLDGLRFL